MKKSLLIIGCGQYGQVTKEIAEDVGYKDIAFLDDNNPNAIGKINMFKDFINYYKDAIVSIGNNNFRAEVFDLIDKYFNIITLLHPKSIVSKSAIIGKGCIIEPLVVIEPHTKIGKGSIIRAGAVIGHNVALPNYSLILPNSYIKDNYNDICNI